MRNRQEIRNFLNAQVGHRVNAKCGVYNGQCVSLIKALFEFLGVPNPYAGRGNAKDAGDTYLRQGIAKSGTGWLNVCVNRSMGGGYGHIWLDIRNEASFEQNGAVALLTTKNTRPFSQAGQVVNLDKWVAATPTGRFTVRVDKAIANVRSAPKSSASLSGSRQLFRGQTFVAVSVVTGENVLGNNKWYKSEAGNYVWSQGLTKI